MAEEQPFGKGARDRSRTDTSLRTADFESAMYTSFITPAKQSAHNRGVTIA